AASRSRSPRRCSSSEAAPRGGAALGVLPSDRPPALEPECARSGDTSRKNPRGRRSKRSRSRPTDRRPDPSSMPFRWFDLLAILLVPLGAWLAREHLLCSAARQAAERVAGENASLPSRTGFAAHGVDDRHDEPAWEAYGRALRLSLTSDPA